MSDLLINILFLRYSCFVSTGLRFASLELEHYESDSRHYTQTLNNQALNYVLLKTANQIIQNKWKIFPPSLIK